MIDVIETLNGQRVPTQSYIAAAVHCNQTRYPQVQYEQYLSILLDKPIFCESEILARLTYGYFAQEYIWWNNRTETINEITVDSIYNIALEKAKTLFTKNPWMWVEDEKEQVEKFNENGTVKRKKGWKRDRALEIFRNDPSKPKKEIMKLYQDELDMTVSGSQTYYYNSKKKLEKETK